MRRRAIVAALVTLIGISAIPLTPDAQTLAVYDDFSSAAIDGRRWSGSEQTIAPASLVTTRGGWSNQVEGPWTRHPRFSVINTAVNVRIVDGQLELRLTTAGGQQADPDVAPGHGRLSLRLSAAAWQAPQPVSRLQAQVTIAEAEAQPCRSTGGSRARAQLFAHLFNDGASPLDGDLTGDVFATLSLQRTSFDADRIVGVVSRCRDSRCTLADDVGSVVFNRTWRRGPAHQRNKNHHPPRNPRVINLCRGGITAPKPDLC
jgi:hypothetical protein